MRMKRPLWWSGSQRTVSGSEIPGKVSRGFKGGVAPYGYDLVKSGQLNKRKHELFNLALNETEAAEIGRAHV